VFVRLGNATGVKPRGTRLPTVAVEEEFALAGPPPLPVTVTLALGPVRAPIAGLEPELAVEGIGVRPEGTKTAGAVAVVALLLATMLLLLLLLLLFAM